MVYVAFGTGFTWQLTKPVGSFHSAMIRLCRFFLQNFNKKACKPGTRLVKISVMSYVLSSLPSLIVEYLPTISNLRTSSESFGKWSEMHVWTSDSLLRISENLRKIFRNHQENKQNDTCPLVDTNFIFSCSTRYLTRLLCSLVRYQVEHWMKQFITTCQHVISSMWQYASCILLWSVPFPIFHKLMKVDFSSSLFLCLEIFIFHIGNIVYLQSSRSCWWVNIFNKFHSRWWFANNPLSPTLNMQIFLTGILCICYQWYYLRD